MKSSFDLDDVLEAINLPVASRRVYKSILEMGSVTPATLAQSLQMPRPSVYDQLRVLKLRGLVIDKDIDNKTFYSVSPLEDIEKILEDQISSSKSILEDFKLAKSNLKWKSQSKAKIRFFETQEAIERSLYNMLFSKNKTIYSLWPYDEMLQVVSKKKLEDLNEKRISKRIKLKVIWPYSAKQNKVHIWQDRDELIYRKFLSKTQNFNMGYIICDDKVIFISSESEGYAFIVDSQEFADTQMLHFNSLWSSTK